jgi:hypothetical protein
LETEIEGDGKRKTEGGRTITVRTIKAWNSIASNLKKSHDTSSFKRNFFNLSSYFLTKQRETLTFESFLSTSEMISNANVG